MKHIIFILVALVWLTNAEALSDCYNISTIYSRNISASVWNWQLNETSLAGVKYQTGPPAVYIQASEVRQAVNDAITAWAGAANVAGLRISMQEVQTGANLTVEFVSLGFLCGDGLNTSIKLNKDRIWGNYTSR